MLQKKRSVFISPKWAGSLPVSQQLITDSNNRKTGVLTWTPVFLNSAQQNGGPSRKKSFQSPWIHPVLSVYNFVSN